MPLSGPSEADIEQWSWVSAVPAARWLTGCSLISFGQTTLGHTYQLIVELGTPTFHLDENTAADSEACGTDLVLSESHRGFTDDFAKISVGPFRVKQSKIWEVLTFNRLFVIV